MTIKLDLGLTVCTQAFNELLAKVDPQEIADIANRHKQGDWGDTPEEDCELNNHNVSNNTGYVMSSFTLAETKVWVHTVLGEKHERITTFMLPSDY